MTSELGESQGNRLLVLFAEHKTSLFSIPPAKPEFIHASSCASKVTSTMADTTWTIRLKAIGSGWSHLAKLKPSALGEEIFAIVASEGGFAKDSFKLMCSGRYAPCFEVLLLAALNP